MASERLLTDGEIDLGLGWAFGFRPMGAQCRARSGPMVRVAIPNRQLSSTDMLAYELCELAANDGEG